MNKSLEFARRLLQKAADDEQMLRRLMGDPASPLWGAGFHAQQAAEKAIKSVLAAHAMDFPMTHDLGVLLELLSAGGLALPASAESLPRLNPFGVAFRYDVADDEEELPDSAWMAEVVRQSVSWARQAIGLLSDEKP